MSRLTETFSVLMCRTLDWGKRNIPDSSNDEASDIDGVNMRDSNVLDSLGLEVPFVEWQFFPCKLMICTYFLRTLKIF